MSNKDILIILDKFKKTFMKSGKKSTSFALMKKSLVSLVQSQNNVNEVLLTSTENVKPFFLIKSQKKGKRVLQIPYPLLDEGQRLKLACGWLVKNSLKTTNQTTINRFVQELLDSKNNEGATKKTTTRVK